MYKVSLSEAKLIDLILRKNPVDILTDSEKKYRLEGVTSVAVKTIFLATGNRTMFTIYCIEASSGPSLYRCCLVLTRNEAGPYTGELIFLDKHV